MLDIQWKDIKVTTTLNLNGIAGIAERTETDGYRHTIEFRVETDSEGYITIRYYDLTWAKAQDEFGNPVPSWMERSNANLEDREKNLFDMMAVLQKMILMTMEVASDSYHMGLRKVNAT